MSPRKKGGARIFDLPYFQDRNCEYCGEKFKSQINITEYPNGRIILKCRATCGKTGKHLLQGEKPTPLFEKLRVIEE